MRRFDAVYGGESTQEQLFREIAPGIDSVLNGYNCTVFAYGQTGAGKTHTMMGTPNDPGIIPRIARDLLRRLDNDAETQQWSVTMSYLEIYNEKVNDLLDARSVDLPVREDITRTIFVPGLTQRAVHSFGDFSAIYEQAAAGRKSASTALNAHSSRSHAVLSLTVRRKTATAVSTSKLHLIDLAGSEDNRLTANTGVRLTESSSINQSLFVLGQVVDALRAGGGKRVPYRDSKLTRLLQDSLGGSAFGIVVANVAPGANSARETFRTLNFASKSREVVNAPVQHVVALPPPPPVAPLRGLKSMAAMGGTSSTAAAARVAAAAGLLRRDTGILEQELAAASKSSVRSAPTQPTSAADTLLTPITRARATEQVVARAQQFERAGDSERALQIYRGALQLVGDDNSIRIRIAALEVRQQARERQQSAQSAPVADDVDAPATVAKPKGGRRRQGTKRTYDENAPANSSVADVDDGGDVDDDEEFVPASAAAADEDDDDVVPSVPAVVAKKRGATKKAATKPKKQGSKIKSPLAELVVPEGVTEKLLALLNNGTVAELTSLQSIGKRRAEQIVARRQTQPFERVADLETVGFGAKMIDNFVKRNIYV